MRPAYASGLLAKLAMSSWSSVPCATAKPAKQAMMMNESVNLSVKFMVAPSRSAESINAERIQSHLLECNWTFDREDLYFGAIQVNARGAEQTAESVRTF